MSEIKEEFDIYVFNSYIFNDDDIDEEEGADVFSILNSKLILKSNYLIKLSKRYQKIIKSNDSDFNKNSCGATWGYKKTHSSVMTGSFMGCNLADGNKIVSNYKIFGADKIYNHLFKIAKAKRLSRLIDRALREIPINNFDELPEENFKL